MDIKKEKNMTFVIIFCDSDIAYLDGCLRSIPSGYEIILQRNFYSNARNSSIHQLSPQLADFPFIADDLKNENLKMLEFAFYKSENCESHDYVNNTFDFGIARNQAMSYATNDWIFILDADERIVVEPDLKELKIFDMAATDEIYDGGYISIMLQTQKKFNMPHDEIYAIPIFRIFRNKVGYKFKYRVHEILSIEKEMNNRGKLYLDTPIMIKHWGYYDCNNPDYLLNKAFRNIGLAMTDVLNNLQDEIVLRKLHEQVIDLVKIGYLPKDNLYKYMDFLKIRRKLKEYEILLDIDLKNLYFNLQYVCRNLQYNSKNKKLLLELLNILDIMADLGYWKEHNQYELYKRQFLQRFS